MMIEFVFAPMRWYMGQLPSVADPDRELADSVADQVVDLLASGEFIVRQSVALAGLATDDDLEEGPARLLKLSPLERGHFVDVEKGPSALMEALAGEIGFVAPTHVLEVDRPARDIRELTMLRPPYLITALQLHQIPVVGTGMVASRVIPEWFGLGISGKPIVMRRLSEEPRRAITASQFKLVCSTAEKLKGQRLDDPQRPSETALRRFGLGCGREDFADALVDFVVALEALLLPYGDDQRAEMSFRFRLHGAHFIADSSMERPVLYRRLEQLYSIRSRLVHGGKLPAPEEVQAAAKSAHSLAARGLLKAITQGFPDGAYFKRAVLWRAARSVGRARRLNMACKIRPETVSLCRSIDHRVPCPPTARNG
jgi:hypothetical protein